MHAFDKHRHGKLDKYNWKEDGKKVERKEKEKRGGKSDKSEVRSPDVKVYFLPFHHKPILLF